MTLNTMEGSSQPAECQPFPADTADAISPPKIKVVRQPVSRNPLETPFLAGHPINFAKQGGPHPQRIYAPSELPHLDPAVETESTKTENRAPRAAPADVKSRMAIRDGRTPKLRALEVVAENRIHAEGKPAAALLIAAKKNAKRLAPIQLPPML
jgi:hypothetical protein